MGSLGFFCSSTGGGVLLADPGDPAKTPAASKVKRWISLFSHVYPKDVTLATSGKSFSIPFNIL